MNPVAFETDKKKALKARLARIEGQLRGIQRLIDEDATCEKVAQQLSAARKALDKSFFDMIGCALESKLQQKDLIDQEVTNELSEIKELLKKYG